MYFTLGVTPLKLWRNAYYVYSRSVHDCMWRCHGTVSEEVRYVTCNIYIIAVEKAVFGLWIIVISAEVRHISGHRYLVEYYIAPEPLNLGT